MGALGQSRDCVCSGSPAADVVFWLAVDVRPDIVQRRAIDDDRAKTGHVQCQASCLFPALPHSWLWARTWIVAVFMLAAMGCAGPERMDSVPVAETARAAPLGIANGRFFPGVQLAEMKAEWQLALRRQRQVLGLPLDAKLPAADFLAISGGGDNGAFGSGLLVGWTEAGNRPQFQFVTGVSTGALIAPFAFLGPDYDQPLREIYTTIAADDVFTDRGIIGGIFDDAMSDTTPLWKLISHYVDAPLVSAIAHEYEKGRLLLIGTTDLDAQRSCIWNIGAIAASGNPGAVDLIRKILRASSAVPGIFQPVLIDVELDGKHYQEMHVDGGRSPRCFSIRPASTHAIWPIGSGGPT